MYSVMVRSALVLGIALTAESVFAPALWAQPDLKARCSQLVSYYSRYGSSRGEDTDGNRDFIRLGAEVDCRDGRYKRALPRWRSS